MSDAFHPERPMHVFRRLRYYLVRHSFTSRYRQPFYETLRFLLDNKTPLAEALQMIGDVHTDFGRRWSPYIELVDDCLEALSDNRAGRELQDVLAVWAPSEEAALISAGMQSGGLPRALMQADKLIMARRRILLQVLFASIYPLVLVILGGALLAVNNLMLVPTLSSMSDPKNWSGALGLMNTIATWISEWGVVAGVGGVLLVIGVTWSLPRWCGQLRRLADYALPWSLYKDLQGAVFLMNVAALLGAGVPELKALQVLHSYGSAWLQERLEAAMDCMTGGDALGMALRHCGYRFPSQEAANYLSLLGKGDGASTLISNYADRWLEQALQLVARRANTAKFFSLLLIITFFLLILEMVMQIQDIVSLSVH
ncbi:type II secretion system F family protein [Musicola keenii]|uniref:type II secretion system F family protein n=1 Tax=Musicola keenii TaxID=2884250 RepID=UPI001CE39722|nr:type II secretion system F family protein [Musicola keenii]